jgi:hypothetical protein
MSAYSPLRWHHTLHAQQLVERLLRRPIWLRADLADAVHCWRRGEIADHEPAGGWHQPPIYFAASDYDRERVSDRLYTEVGRRGGRIRVGTRVVRIQGDDLRVTLW